MPGSQIRLQTKHIDGYAALQPISLSLPLLFIFTPLVIWGIFCYNNICFERLYGTLVCVYFPDYMDGINASGWHTSNVVYEISTGVLGTFGGILAIVGVIVCPITSGDTAFRSARLILAETFQLDQTLSYIIGAVAAASLLVVYLVFLIRENITKTVLLNKN